MTDAGERVHARLFVPGTPDGLDAWRRALAPRGIELHEDALRGAELPSPLEVEWVENPRTGRSAARSRSGPRPRRIGRRSTPREGRSCSTSASISTASGGRSRRSATRSRPAARSRCASRSRGSGTRSGAGSSSWTDDPLSLYRAAVVVLDGEADVATCGMHVFSLPDAQVALEDGADRKAANALLGALNVFQIAEDPLLLSGHTFAPDAETPRRVLHRWPDATYPTGHVCHNPFGVWRLGSPGGTAEPSPELALVFMPALVVLLTAEERRAGRPLTRDEVERTTAGAIVMTVEHRRAQAMERNRGYADLDPRRAWEQWQIARRRLEGE